MKVFRSNCLAWALGQVVERGGYIAARRSRFWLGPHFLHCEREGQRFRHFVPVGPLASVQVGWRFWLLVWFEGRVIEGDPSAHNDKLRHGGENL